MKYTQNCIELDLSEFEEETGCVVQNVSKDVKIKLSYECLQDICAKQHLLFIVRAGEISEEEWSDYQKFDEFLDRINLDELSKKVVFERDNHGEMF